jgi:hypothetical protein
MAGGLINIISYGANDLYLTGSPEITFFKIIYRRYTNFSKESVALTVNKLDFNSTVEVVIPRIGDLLQELYLQIEIPSFYLLKSQIGINIDHVQVENALNAYNTALSDYNIITTFMAINANAYRVGYNDYQALRIPAIVMITDIINVFGQFPASSNIVSNYKSILSTEYDIIKQTKKNDSQTYVWLHSQFSNISEIANSINININNNITYTTTQILSAITSAINFSTKVQNYFYNKKLTLYNKYLDLSSQYAKFAWNNNIGHTIIDYVDLLIGGEKIDRHYGQWIGLWHDLSGNKEQQSTYNKLIGNVSELTTFDRKIKPAYTLNIPLLFWFCKTSGLSLPLIALRYNQVSLLVKLKKFEDCAYVERNPVQLPNNMITLSDIWEDGNYLLNSTLYADYIYLDVLERKRFAQSAHEYLITRVQYLNYPNITTTSNTFELDFFTSPCKELIWTVQKNAYTNNNTNYHKSMWQNYSLTANGKGNPVKKATLTFNGYTRINGLGGNFFNYLQPCIYHSNTVNDGINVYSFGLYPEEIQPSGSCNFSRIADISLTLLLDDETFYYNRSDIDPTIIPSSDLLDVSPYSSVYSNYITPFDALNVEVDTGINDNTNLDLQTDSTRSTTANVSIYAISNNILRIIGGTGALAYQ